MGKFRRQYSKEFKLEVVRRSMEEGERIKDLALEYKLHQGVLSRWRKEFIKSEGSSFPGNGKSNLSEDQQEIKRLQKALKEAKLEKEILKKAISIFSKSDGRYMNS